MATLAGQQIKNKYGNLLHVEGGLTASPKTIEDGQGNGSALAISTAMVEVDALKFSTSPNTSASETTAVFLDGNNNVITRELGSQAFSSSSGIFEECFIGYVPADQILEAAGSDIVVFASPDNTDQQSSYHFGNQPAKLELDPINGEYIENISGSTQVVMVDMTSAIQSSNANRGISFTLVKYTGGSWVSQSGFLYTTVSTVPEGVSFWGVYTLADGERLRINISSVDGGIYIKQGSLFRFIVKEVGNII